MKPTKIQAYEAALTKIVNNALIEPMAAKAAQTAMALFLVDHEADRAAQNVQIKDLMIAKGLIFASAQELSDALNAAGLKTTRGKEWSKSTATRTLTEVRPLIQAEIGATTAPAPAETTAAVVNEPTSPNLVEAVLEPAPEPAVVQAVVVEVEPVVEVSPAMKANADDLDELDDLLRDFETVAA